MSLKHSRINTLRNLLVMASLIRLKLFLVHIANTVVAANSISATANERCLSSASGKSMSFLTILAGFPVPELNSHGDGEYHSYSVEKVNNKVMMTHAFIIVFPLLNFRFSLFS